MRRKWDSEITLLRLPVMLFFSLPSVDTTRGEAGRVFLLEDILMTSVRYSRSLAAFKPLALVSALASLSFPVAAQVETGQKLSPVTVSESRFENTPASSPIGATVITAEQIREAGIGNVNEAIRKIGGVYGRQNLNGTSDFALDLRGFGGTSDQNLVVLVDGIRISENEQATAIMSSVSIENVERIEIVRGGSSVLYGAGATGGTIQIITKRGLVNKTRGVVFVEAGNRNAHEIRASLAKGWDAFSFNANIGSLQTDNYRVNNKLKQENFSGGLEWALANGRVGMRVESARQDSGLPGGLTWNQYLQNPRQTLTPLNTASIDTNRYTLFAEKKFGTWDLAFDLSHRDRESESFYAPTSRSVAYGRATQFSPRARHKSSFGSSSNEFVMGVDLLDSNRRVESVGSATVPVSSQRSKAIYLRDELKWDRFTLAAGLRHERFSEDANSGFSEYGRKLSLNAWDMQGVYQFDKAWSFFVKSGKSYRVANVDDNGFTLNNALLLPQTSQDIELGTSFVAGKNAFTTRVFQHKLTNEIFYDPVIANPSSWNGQGANVNLDPTKREGVEVEASAGLMHDLALKAVVQHVSAKFTAGPYAGREMTLVPRNTVTLRLNWLPGNGHSADIGVQWADSQRYAGDFTNACGERIPSYALLDARYAFRRGPWEFAVTGNNLTDRDYYSQAFGSCRASASIYTDPGRSVKLSIRRDF